MRQTKQTQRTTHQSRAGALRAAEQRRADDEVLIIVAKDLLADQMVGEVFGFPANMVNELLERFVELAEKEIARRPAHRPRSNSAGLLVWMLKKKGLSQAEARKRAAKILRKSRNAIARADNRHKQREMGRK